jgi:hypothetical protein
VLFGDGEGGFSPHPIITNYTSKAQRRASISVNNGPVEGTYTCFSRRAMKLFLSLLAVSAVVCAQGIFTQTSNSSFNGGLGPFGYVTGDFNGDGNLDVAFMDEGTGSVMVALGDGRGGFAAAPSKFCAAAQPAGIVAADFNGDGKLDLAVESSLAGPFAIGQGSIVVCLGDGNGEFTPYGANSFTNPLTTGGLPGSMATGDFNGDGIPDLVVSNQNGLVILLGDGKGGFARGASPSGRGAVSGQIAVADFVGNGQSDIVVINSQGLTVFVCDGKNNFTTLPIQSLPFNYSGYLARILLADFNNDGFVDLLIGNRVLTGDGRGGFTVQAALLISPAGSPEPYTVADFDGDGNLDVAILDATRAAVFLGKGDGTFNLQPAAQFPVSIAPDNDLGVAGDFNNDGKPDFLLASGRVFLNVLPGIFVNPASVEFSTGTKPIVVKTVPETGVSAVSNQPWLRFSSGQISVSSAGLAPGIYRGTVQFTLPGYFGASVKVTLRVTKPSGALNLSSNSPLGILGPYNSRYLQGDFDGDGKLDLLVVNDAAMTVWFGDGTGNFVSSMKPVTVPSVSSIAIADFNRDGKLDVVVTPVTASGPSAETIFQVMLGDGSGGFTAGPTTKYPYNGYDPGFLSPQVADFNNDGIPDLCLARTVFLGDGTGGFTVKFPVPGSAPQVAGKVIADFNRDGNMDIAYTELASPYLYVLLGDGKGGLRQTQKIAPVPLAQTLGGIVKGDWNGDGTAGVAVSVPGGSRIILLTGNGTGPLAASRTLATPGNVTGMAAGDIDGDGLVDLVVTTASGLGVYLNDGRGGVGAAPAASYALSGVPVVGDLNGDGRPDITAGGPGGLEFLLGGLAQPKISLKQLPPTPFDIRQTVSLVAAVSADPNGFRAPTGTIALLDGGTLVGRAPLGNGAYFTTPFVAATHNFTAVYSGDDRNGPATALLKVIESGVPATIEALSNAYPLQAIVRDANNNPVPGVRVTFNAPATGPGGLFYGSLTAAVLTDAQGIATAPPFQPNGVPGTFFITAITTIGGSACTFAESN